MSFVSRSLHAPLKVVRVRAFQLCRSCHMHFAPWWKMIFYYRKRGSVSYIVREVHSVREREIQREKDGSDVTTVALKLATSFALLLAKNVHLSIWRRVLRFSLSKNLHLSFSPLDWRWIHTFRCQKRCTFRNGSHSSHCQMAWLTGDRSSKANDRISGCTVLLSRRKNRKNESN